MEILPLKTDKNCPTVTESCRPYKALDPRLPHEQPLQAAVADWLADSHQLLSTKVTLLKLAKPTENESKTTKQLLTITKNLLLDGNNFGHDSNLEIDEKLQLHTTLLFVHWLWPWI